MKFVIDGNFPTLSKAPIAEAVIDFRILPIENWNPPQLKESLIKELPSYSKKIEEGKEFIYSISVDGTQSKQEEFGCMGYKLTSEDGCNIVQFNRQGFVFSRVRQYQDWERFCNEARVLWAVYCKLLEPKKVKRIGVRFINHMVAVENPFNLKDYFNEPPKEQQIVDWNLVHFLYQDVLVVPKSPYWVNVIKTVLPPQPSKIGGIVVLDIDVFANIDIDEFSWESLYKHLEVMRLKKNEAFFSNVPKEKIEEFI